MRIKFNNQFTSFQNLILGFISIFYNRIEIHGQENLPKERALLVSNHPNHLIDPLVIMAGVGYRIRFLAGSRLFSTPILSSIGKKFGTHPIYRAEDIGTKAGPVNRKDVIAKNDAVFAESQAFLQNGGTLALFPEGTTHSQSSVLPIRKGAARIALGTEAGENWEVGLQIVPIGIWYESKFSFKSSILIKVGKPFTLQPYKQMYEESPRKAVRILTKEIQQELDITVKQSKEVDLLHAIPNAEKTSQSKDAPYKNHKSTRYNSPATQACRTLQLKEYFNREDLAHDAQVYASAMKFLGIKEPWLNKDEKEIAKVWFAIMKLILLSPFALIGMLLGFIPYQKTKHLVRKKVSGKSYHATLARSACGITCLLIIWMISVYSSAHLGGWLSAVTMSILFPILCTLAIIWKKLYQSLRVFLQYQRPDHNKQSFMELLYQQQTSDIEDVYNIAA